MPKILLWRNWGKNKRKREKSKSNTQNFPFFGWYTRTKSCHNFKKEWDDIKFFGNIEKRGFKDFFWILLAEKCFWGKKKLQEYMCYFKNFKVFGAVLWETDVATNDYRGFLNSSSNIEK